MQFSDHFRAQVLSSRFVENLKKGLVLIDNSEFTQWGSCFTAGIYSGALRRVSTRNRSALTFGACVHKGLESFFKGSPDFIEASLVEAAKLDLDGLGDPKRNTNTLIMVLKSYTLEYPRYRGMQFDIVKIDNDLAVEKSFSLPLGQITGIKSHIAPEVIEIMWQGKIDLITWYENAISWVDHKTTSVMGERFLDDKIRSSQCLGYTWALRYLSREIFDNKPVFGGRINALASRSAGWEFKQFDIPYPDWKVAEWQIETIKAIRDLVLKLDEFITEGEATPTREHCVTKYGRCPYFDVCDSIPTMRDRMIFDDSYFYVSDWSPLNE